MRQLLHHCTRRQSDRWILNWTRWWWQHAVVLSGNGKLRRRFARSVGRSRRYRIHRNRWRFSRWRLWFGRFLFLDRFSPSYFNRRTIDLCICKIQNTLNWLTYVTRGKNYLRFMLHIACSAFSRDEKWINAKSRIILSFCTLSSDARLKISRSTCSVVVNERLRTYKTVT